MRILIIVFIFLVSSGVANSQSVRIRNADSFKTPLVLVDTVATDMKYFIIAPEKIETVSVFKDSTARAMYGERGRNGVVLISVKDGVKLLRLHQFLDKVGFKDYDKKMPVKIDGTLVKDRELILLDETEIKTVHTTTEVGDITVGVKPKEEKVLNIIWKQKRE